MSLLATTPEAFMASTPSKIWTPAHGRARNRRRSSATECLVLSEWFQLEKRLCLVGLRQSFGLA